MGNRSQLELMGQRLLDTARTELMLAMRFMGPALCSLEPVMDLSTKRVGTDSVSMRYNPTWLMQVYLEHPYIVVRTYLHTILHCLFRHMFGLDEHADEELWDLASDISVESVIDGMDEPAVNRTPSDFREEWYGILEKEVKVLTAERIYRYFLNHEPEYLLKMKLLAEFCADDHVFWRLMSDEKEEKGKLPASQDLKSRQEEWKKTAKRVRSEMKFDAKHAGMGTGSLERILAAETRERTKYRDLLSHFTVNREECRVDPDSFDYVFYTYGMELYGNMPLIEENEFMESNRVRDLVIAIDTSASCSEELLQRFLNETAEVLLDKERFFDLTEIHIVECDTEVKKDVLLKTPDEMTHYLSGFHLCGGGGTDFRPVFRYVEDLQKKGKLRALKGLIYFTDGFGRYPENPPPYEAAFVFWKDDRVCAEDAPDWALSVYLDE